MPDSVLLYSYCYDIGLTPQEGIEMTVSPSGSPSQVSGIVMASKNLYGISDSLGYVSVNVAANANYRVKIPKAQFDIFVSVPASGSVNLGTLI